VATGARRGPGRPRIGPLLRLHAPEATHRELERRAELQGVTVSHLVRQALAEFLAKPESHPYTIQEQLSA